MGSVAPPVSQLAARLSQPIMSDTASSNQLRSLLQRPYGSATPHAATESGSATSGMLLTHSSSASPMVGGTPVSTTRVWVPGSYIAQKRWAHALDNMAGRPSTKIRYFNAVFRIRSHLIRMRIWHVRLNTDPDPGFYDQKLKRITAEKKIFDQKMRFTFPQASIKDVQATEEAFSPQKRTSST